MHADIQFLGSSSDGNCALLRTHRTNILIDAGFSAKQIVNGLAALGSDIEAIDALFLSHEHSDHARGIRGLAQKQKFPIFANRDTADAVQSKLKSTPNWHFFQTGCPFSFRDLKIHPIALPHDAYDPVGFIFHWGKEGDLFEPPQNLAWLTDLGYLPDALFNLIDEVGSLVLEANYDTKMLELDSKRPWSIKQRISGRHGHLSNDAAHEVLERLKQKSIFRKVYIAHISKDCNSLQCIQQKMADLHCVNSFQIKLIDPTNASVHCVQKPS
jgi:phosphoribosyl 1,2-cyclic phosphodiesterase